MTKETSECVGTLLVPSSNLQELSETSTTTDSASGSGSNLQRRVTAGTLLVPSSDLQSTHNKGDESTGSEESAPVGLVRRITNKVNSLPTPTDEEVRDWAGDA